MKKQKRVAVIGGGASGLMASVIAAENGASVCLYEGNDRVGKKILSTGNGKCNLTNLQMSEMDFNSGDLSFVKRALERFSNLDMLKYLHKNGIQTKERNGYVYPLSEQAATVLDFFRIQLKNTGVSVKTESKVERIEYNGKCYRVFALGKAESFDSVILSNGGKAAPKTGSDGSGYSLAKSFGHRIVPVEPGLVQLRCREEWFKAVAGVRVEGAVSVYSDGVFLTKELGEIQLTEYGISGIPVFQLSRKVNYELRKKKVVTAELDFLPQFGLTELETIMKEKVSRYKENSLEELFTGFLNKKIMQLSLKIIGLKPDILVKNAEFSKLTEVIKLCKCLVVHIFESNGFEQAQVCAGGVDVNEVSDFMESKYMPGCFFAGEILDVDGRCGGYNLQWAWTSGYIAGLQASGGGKL